MQNKELILGIDTSNYKTSVAVTDREGNIVFDSRELLHVKTGEKGLRQSEALFQHIKIIPCLIEKAMKISPGETFAAIGVATRPRKVEGSYMPVFKAGESVGRSIAGALGIELFEFSHQEGHIEAVKYYSELKNENHFLCWHLSGGTCELLKIDGEKVEIIGGSKDISFGQLIDRVGVGLGLNFPAGEKLDSMAQLQYQGQLFKRIEFNDLKFNLSGIETKAIRNLEEPNLVPQLFEKIADVLIRVTQEAIEDTGIDKVLFTGGVAESTTIRNSILHKFSQGNIVFGEKNLSSDNAVGISLLGGKKLWP